MPNTCCVPGCRSGYKGNVEKVSLFCLPADAEQRDRWKRAIPRQETVGFLFDSKYVRVCEKHFDASDIVRADVCTVNRNIVSLPRDRPRLVEGAAPRIFEGLPAYLSKPRQRSRGLTKRPPVKRPREPSPDCDATVANADVSIVADEEIDGVSGDIARVSTSFEHPCDSSEVIQVIIDPPHIFKCIRNNLRKAGKFLVVAW
ncbi:uncharacterized protein LOC119161015 isoform X3 [Rhipicephalus microplus]|uniref:uncharacterized protein LOC119161015 isoform X3 n=1 Tax=Rhipicephalus microplus TaxID=6941 RepID=UPI003F6B9EF5